MRVTRLLENPASAESFSSIGQGQFVSLLAKHKALLLQSDEVSDPLTVEGFAEFMEGLKLEKYEYLGGAGEGRVVVVLTINLPCSIVRILIFA